MNFVLHVLCATSVGTINAVVSHRVWVGSLGDTAQQQNQACKKHRQDEARKEAPHFAHCTRLPLLCTQLVPMIAVTTLRL